MLSLIKIKKSNRVIIILLPSLICLFILISSSLKAQLNSRCETALILTDVSNFCSSAGGFTNIGGEGASVGKPACWKSPYISKDVWFQFTAIAPNVLITINGNTNNLGTLNDPQVALYTANCTTGMWTPEICGV